jgi:hypothetical protein
LRRSCPTQGYDATGAEAKERANAGPVRAPGPLDRVPGRNVLEDVEGQLGRDGKALAAGHQHVQGASRDLGQLVHGEHRVDEPAPEEVLCGLHAFGERLAVQGLEDPGPEEPDQGARFGDRDVPERSP